MAGSSDEAGVGVWEVNARQIGIGAIMAGQTISDTAVKVRRRPPARVGEVEAEVTAQQEDERERQAARPHLRTLRLTLRRVGLPCGRAIVR